MKNNPLRALGQNLRLALLTLLLFGLVYPLFIWGIGQLTSPDKAIGSPVLKGGKIIGFANEGQAFTKDEYFQGRPSAVNYNAAAAGGSNMGPTNPAQIKLVHDRLDTLLAHNPGVKSTDVPSELLTASGSGLDPDLSPEAALLQVPRIARVRHLKPLALIRLVHDKTEMPLFGFIGRPKVNVLALNLALEQLK